VLFFILVPALHPALHPFPTRRSSDLRDVPIDDHSPRCLPPIDTRLLTTAISSAGSTGLARWVWKPAWSARVRSSPRASAVRATRSEEHTSELQSRENLVCRLLLEKKN